VRLAMVMIRRLVDERTATLGLALLVFATALAAAVGPRLLEQLSNEAVRTELAAAPAFERHMVIYETARRQATPPRELADVERTKDDMRADLPAEIDRLIDSTATVVETPLFHALEGTSFSTVLDLRIHEGAFERLVLVDGRLPTDRIGILPDERPTALAGQRLIVYEALLPASAASEMGVGVGDRLLLTVWLGDQLNLGLNIGTYLNIVGTYELAQPDDEFWINDTTVAGWRLQAVGNDLWLRTTALLAPELYGPLINFHGQGLPLLYQWRFFTDTDRLSADGVPAAVEALRRLEATPPRSGLVAVPSDAAMSSGLLRMLLHHQAVWRSAESVLSVIAIGALAIAIATLAVVSAAASSGRRRVTGLLRARGATPRHVLGAMAAEAAVIALPAVALAAALSIVLVPAAGFGRAALPATLVWATLTVILLALVRAGASAPSEPGRGPRVTDRPAARRLVSEMALVAVAIGGALLLRERGISAVGSAAEGSGPDPLIAAVPALVGVAAGIVAMRVYPLPTRLLAALAGRRRDLVPALAVRRAVRGGSSASVLLILVATASLGAFGSATFLHLERGAELGAWQQVGAEYRLTSARLALPAALDETQLPAVEAAARASVRSVDIGRGTASLLAIDPAAYQRVTADTPAEPHFPAEMSAAVAAEGGPLPAIAAGSLGLRRGETIEARLGANIVTLRVVDVRDTFAGASAADRFVVVPMAHLEAALDARLPIGGMSFVRAAPGIEQRLRDALAPLDVPVTLDSRGEVAEQTRSAPVMAALRTLVGAGALVALLYAALAIAASLALAAAAQRDQLAHLRALGLARREQLWLTLIEYGPAALVGYLLGIGLGLGLFAFLRPGLGLAVITGSQVEIPVGVDPLHLGALLVAVIAILVVGWLLGILAQRDTSPATAIRRGID
jgi:putative ABC transport system permease protein